MSQGTTQGGTKDRNVGVWLFLVGISVLLGLSRTIHYLLFHTLAELFAVTVSFSIFALTWTSQKYLKNSYLTILGAAYGTIGVIDVFHTLTFKGMNLIPAVTTNYPTQFWLAARALEAIALVVAALFIRRAARFSVASWVFAALGMASCLAVWSGVLPDTFLDGIGLTPFKIGSEYSIVGILLIALVLLWRARKEFAHDVYWLVSGSLLLAIATEICFIHYVSFYDYINELGHYFRLYSVVLAFLAIVVTGIRRPSEILYRQVVEKEQQLKVINERLEKSEDSLNQAQAVAGVGSWQIDMASKTLSWSDETFRIFGLAAGTRPTVDTLATFIHPDDRERVSTAWKAALGGATFDLEHRIVVAKQTKWIRERAEFQFAPDGRALAAVGSVQDITDRKQAEDAIRISEARLRRAELASRSGNWEIHLDSQSIVCSDGAAKLYGIEKHEVHLATVQNMPLPEYRSALDTALSNLVENNEPYDLEFKITTADSGEIRDIHSIAEFDTERRVLFGVIQDITERKAALQALHNSEMFAKSTLDAVPESICVLDRTGTIVAVNKAWRDFCMQNHPAPEQVGGFIGFNYLAICNSAIMPGADEAKSIADGILKVINNELDAFAVEYSCAGPAERRWFIARATHFHGDSGNVLVAHEDITERKKAEQRLETLAQIDVLTGLANRRHFMTLAEQELSRAQRYGGALSLLMVDIDHFKSINDTYGHHTGDLVLQKLGALFQEALRDIDIFGRVGGEEFAGVLPQTSAEQALDVAERLRQIVERAEFTRAHGLPLHITLSIGVTTLTDRSSNIDTLLGQADSALYRAKSGGRNQVRVFSH